MLFLKKRSLNNSEGLALLGALDLARGKKTDAITAYGRRLVTLTPPERQHLQMLLSNALFVSGDRAGANAAMKVAVDLAKTSAEARQAQINLFFAEKGYEWSNCRRAEDFQKANHTTQAGCSSWRYPPAGRAYLSSNGHLQKKSFAASPANGTLLQIAGNVDCQRR